MSFKPVGRELQRVKRAFLCVLMEEVGAELNMCVCVLSECNCHAKADECYFNQTVADLSLSLNIQGQNRGGGVCIGCRDNTAGINCQTCIDGYYRPAGVRHRHKHLFLI